MKIVNEHGDVAKIDDKLLPEDMSQWLYQDTQLIRDDAQIEPIWEVAVTEIPFNSRQNFEDYKLVDLQILDHEPTQEEIMYLLAKNNCLRWGYVTVSPGWRYKEVYD